MSVYTQLNSQAIRDLLDAFELGQYQSHQGISAGVENTNYFVETHTHSLVLTVFEKLTRADIPFYQKLCEHLYNQHCKVPRPFRNKAGKFLMSVENKPAVFVEKLTGHHVEATADYALNIAAALADVHAATQTFSLSKAHSHDIQWVQQHALALMDSLSAPDQALLRQSLSLLDTLPHHLPKGIIHGDLFQDNALFDNGQVSGIIDWYFAGFDVYALDLAITMNDWCKNEQGLFDRVAGEAFIAAYHAHRPLSDDEIAAIPVLQIQSATRFWLSRLLAQRLQPQSDDHITVKDPEQMKQLLAQLLSYT